jgi:hypothetical protein
VSSSCTGPCGAGPSGRDSRGFAACRAGPCATPPSFGVSARLAQQARHFGEIPRLLCQSVTVSPLALHSWGEPDRPSATSTSSGAYIASGRANLRQRAGSSTEPAGSWMENSGLVALGARVSPTSASHQTIGRGNARLACHLVRPDSLAGVGDQRGGGGGGGGVYVGGLPLPARLRTVRGGLPATPAPCSCSLLWPAPSCRISPPASTPHGPCRGPVPQLLLMSLALVVGAHGRCEA